MHFSVSGRDALSFHNNMPFSTTDVDNDLYKGKNCAAEWGNGGNWYNGCLSMNLNGVYGAGKGLKYMSWKGFHVDIPVTALRKMRWMVREIV